MCTPEIALWSHASIFSIGSKAAQILLLCISTFVTEAKSVLPSIDILHKESVRCGREDGVQVVCNDDCCIEWFWVSMKWRIRGNKYLIRKHV